MGHDYEKIQEQAKKYSAELIIKNYTSKPLEFLPEPWFGSGKLSDGQKFQDVPPKSESVVVIHPNPYIKEHALLPDSYEYLCSGWVMFTHEILRACFQT